MNILKNLKNSQISKLSSTSSKSSFLDRVFVHTGIRRNYLSESYKCNEAWNNRLQSPLLSNVKIEELFLELDKRFTTKKKISCVDVDLFACGITTNNHFEELENVIHRFRKTKYTVNTLDSTHTAVIRTFLQFGKTNEILRILTDRINYGIFPDSFTYNMLMDHFLKQQNYKDATKIAILLMLQDDVSNGISKILALYSCHMYLKDPSREPLYTEEVAVPEEETKTTEVDDDEDVYVRIPFLRNPCFDDHFDITDPHHLIGKTLCLLGKHTKNTAGNSYYLLGLAMYEKWDKVSEFMNQLLDPKNTASVYNEVLIEFETLLASVEGQEDTYQIKSALKEKVEQLKTMTDKVIAEGLHQNMMESLATISQFEALDIQAQQKAFTEWEIARSKALDEEIEEMKRKETETLILNTKKELHEKEQLLFFFENWNKHEMELAEIEAEEKARPSVNVETLDYIPPEI